MNKRKFCLRCTGIALILVVVILLCWLGIYTRSHSYPYVLVDGGYYLFVYNPMIGKPGEQLGTVRRQIEYNIYPWTEKLNQNLDSNILPAGTPVYKNLDYPDCVTVYWEENGNYYNCYLMVDGMATIPGEASKHK